MCADVSSWTLVRRASHPILIISTVRYTVVLLKEGIGCCGSGQCTYWSPAGVGVSVVRIVPVPTSVFRVPPPITIVTAKS